MANDKGRASSMTSQSKYLIILTLAFLLVLTIVALASYSVWVEMGVISLGFHGWAAIIIGSLGSILLGAGLMTLSFYSSRSGHDEKAHDIDQTD